MGGRVGGRMGGRVGGRGRGKGRAFSCPESSTRDRSHRPARPTTPRAPRKKGWEGWEGWEGALAPLCRARTGSRSDAKGGRASCAVSRLRTGATLPVPTTRTHPRTNATEAPTTPPTPRTLREGTGSCASDPSPGACDDSKVHLGSQEGGCTHQEERKGGKEERRLWVRAKKQSVKTFSRANYVNAWPKTRAYSRAR